MTAHFSKRVIIGGLPRAGTTLIRYLFDASDEFIAPPETAYFIRTPEAIKRRPEAIAKRLDRALDIGADKILAILTEASSYQGAFDGIMSAYFNQYGTGSPVGWAEKTPQNAEHYARLVEEADIDLFVSMVRDGRDVVTSKLADKTAYHCPIHLYVKTLSCVYGFSHPRHVIVKYEELAADPYAVMSQLFEHLGLTFDRSALERYQVAAPTRDPAKVVQPKVTEPVSTKWIGRWSDPEHEEIIRTFYGRPDAMYWLSRSGYQ